MCIRVLRFLSARTRFLGEHPAMQGTALLLLALLSMPLSGRAQVPDSVGDPDKLAEGYQVNQTTGAIYYYRIHRDSTVLLRQGKTATDNSGLIMSAGDLAFIADRVEKHVLSPDDSEPLLNIGYEDQRLVLRVSQRFDIYVLGLLLLVSVGGGTTLAWLLWRLSKEKQRRAVLAQSQRALAEGREKERKRLAREIHDGPVQALHGLHMGMKSTLERSASESDLGDELMRVTEELRALSADLHPPALHQFGLTTALRSHADRLDEQYVAQINTDLDEECPTVSQQDALPLFRVAQEALNNAVQHSEAEAIELTLRCTADAVHLTVRDEGDGFVVPEEQGALAEEECYGLLGMQERASALGADLQIDSDPGVGTTVHLVCPRREDAVEKAYSAPAASGNRR